MNLTRRHRFIVRATLGYAVFALTWIFFSDRLLASFTDVAALTWLSTVKGGLFVAVTAALLYFALQAVPDRGGSAESPSLLEQMAGGQLDGRWPRWLIYAFAVGLTVATLALRMNIPIPVEERPLLILFTFPIIFSALLGGLGPGLMATGLAVALVGYYLLPPLDSLAIARTKDQFLLVLLVACGLVVSVLGAALRRALERAETQRRLLQAIVSGTPDAVFIKDGKGRYLLCNEGGARMVGKTVEEILGRDDIVIFPPEVAAELMAEERAVMEKRRTEICEENLTTLTGEHITFLTSKGPVLDRNGKVLGVFGIARDISTRKAAEEEIRRLNADLERRVEERTAALSSANRELQMFASAVSHDLKGPLRGINGFAGLLERGYRDRLEGDGLVFLDHIHRNALRMNALVDDLLAYARLELGEEIARAVDLAAAIRAALAEQQGEIRQKGAEVHLDCPAVTVQANPDGLAQVLRNVLDNALKYSAPDRLPVIDIGGEVDGEHCRVWIRDNGIGFDMVHHDRIFEIFQRLHNDNDYPGTGVGLALVRKAMERMGGRVWAESVPGQGTTLFMELRVHQPGA